MMSFLSAVVTSRYPTTNNRLRNSSNPRQQATINDGRVTLQLVQGRQISFATGTSRTYTPRASGSNSGKQRTFICYNCKGEGHMSKQCTKPKRKWDDSWFKDKVLLVQAQANGQILHEEELAFWQIQELQKMKAKRRNSGTKIKTFEENCYLLLYVVSSKEDTAYQRQLITRIRVMINSRSGVSLFTYTPYAQLVISQRYEVNVIDGN
ncbi:integrase, catalytic region, zinc finger, CCHC-type containing protein [Tanacetum coccineum]